MAQEYIFQLQITGPDMVETFIVPLGDTLVGRQEGTPLVLPSRGVSRRHAQFASNGRNCTLTDLGSANGTYVNGEKLAPNAPVTLNQSDTVQMDQFKLVFEQIPIAPARPAEKPAVEKKAPPLPKPKAEEKPKEEAPREDAQEAPPVVDEKGKKPEAKKEEKAPAGGSRKPPPPPAAPPPSFVTPPPPEPEYDKAPPGLSMETSTYLNYLPGFFHTDFMGRFLAMFESIMAPIEWNIDNFDIYLDPRTAPTDFLPWLSTWFDLTLDDSWTEAQRRVLLAEAHEIYARRGTRWSLGRVLEIYTGAPADIDDLDEKLDPFTFRVKLKVKEREIDRELVERIIDVSKPAHTSYDLQFA